MIVVLDLADPDDPVTVDGDAALHLAAALAAHRRKVDAARRRHPQALTDLETMLSRRVTRGQGGSDLGEVDAVGNGAPRELFTYEEAARMLGVSRSTVKRRVAAGDLPAVNIGRARRITRDDLDTYIEELRHAQR